MSKESSPIRVIKAGDKSTASVKTDSVAAASAKKVEPEAQFSEVEPGVYDITFMCSCGERTVIRCHSLTPPPKPAAPASSKPAAPAIPTPAPPTSRRPE